MNGICPRSLYLETVFGSTPSILAASLGLMSSSIFMNDFVFKVFDDCQVKNKAGVLTPINGGHA